MPAVTIWQSEQFVGVFQEITDFFLTTNDFTFIRFVPTFIRYSCDGVSVQHSIQEGVRRLSDLEKQKTDTVRKEGLHL